MKANIIKPIVGGIVATLVMTMVMFMAPFMGLPKMSAARMLADMMHVPIEIGWMMHFMIGIIFSITYAKLFINWVKKINSHAIKGLLFGLAVFIFAQVMMAIMGAIMPAPKMEGSMLPMIIGSMIGHLIYGLVVGLIVTDKKPSLSLA
jgi:hypothetical protein